MNGRWRCALCETVNDGGGACAACGAPRAQAAAPVTEPNAAPRGDVPVDEGRRPEVLAQEPSIRRRRGEPPRDGTQDVDDHLGFDRPVDAGDGYDGVEIDVRPRVRWFGCCLPVVLGMLVVLLGAGTAIARVAMWAW